MAETFVGKVEFKNSQGDVVLTIDPDADFVQIVIVAGKQILIGDKFCNVNMPNDCIAKRYFANTVGGQIIIGDDNGNVHMPNDCIAKRYFARADGVDCSIHVFNHDGSREIIIGDQFGNVHMPNDCIAERYFARGDSFFDGSLTVKGDIVLANADCAEHFDISQTEQVEPGTVMVLGEEGTLEPSQRAYDKRVAGVISGAGDFKPGIVLDKQQSGDSRMPVALLGKVYCKVDAQYARVEVGDLLTTSPTMGHAMKAEDPLKAFGSVIGKALRPLQEGLGLVPILIALQ